MGIEKQKLEMLFMIPEERGKGLGKKLINYGRGKYNINELTVNEENYEARRFYEYIGLKNIKGKNKMNNGNHIQLYI